MKVKSTSSHWLGRFHTRFWRASELERRLLLAGDLGAAVAADVSMPAIVLQPISTEAASRQAASTRSVQNSSAIVFVAPDIADSETLLRCVAADAEIQLLAPDAPLLTQITNKLNARSGIQSIHVVTHGSPGKLHLGDQVVDVTTLNRQEFLLGRMAKSCVAGADLMIYGCDVAGNETGQAFVKTLAKLTGIDVAASSNKTGSGIQESDWILETEFGSIESQIVFDRATRQRFSTVLNITVNAAGSTGEEMAQLLVDDAVVAQWTVTTDEAPFVYETEQAIRANQVKVRFVNDLYRPEQGLDRNLSVGSIQIDDQLFQTNDSTTYSTGVWREGQGITPGFGLGQTLFANGVFQYAAEEPLGDVNFGGRNWNTNAGTTVQFDASSLSVTADGADGVAWSTIDVTGGDRVQLAVTGTALLPDGRPSFVPSDAGVGLDFFDANGVEIGEAVYELVAVGSPFENPVVDVPEGTAYGTVFVWARDNPDTPNATARIIDLQINPLATGDTTPPQVEFLSDGRVVTEPSKPIELLTRFTDENEIIASNVTLFVTNSSGSEVGIASTFTNSDSLSDRTARSLFDPDPTRSIVTSANNGVYTVSTRGGPFNSVRDAAGNQVEDQVIGTFTIDVPESLDVTPPEVSLSALSVQSISGPATPGFGVQVSDRESRLAQTDLSEAVRITGPNDYDRVALFTFSTNDSDLRANYIFDLFGGEPLVPGEYFISINGLAFQDDPGNSPASGVIGSITLIA